MKLKIPLATVTNPHFVTGFRKLGLLALKDQKLTWSITECLELFADKGKVREKARLLLVEKYGEKDGEHFTVTPDNMVKFQEELEAIDQREVTCPIYKRIILPTDYEKLWPASVEPFNAFEMANLKSVVEFPFSECEQDKEEVA